MKPSQFTGGFLLTGAKTQFGNVIPIHDDGSGPLFIHRDSTGISGIVRASTFEDARGICEDEFFPEANETIEDLRQEYNFTRRHAKIIRLPDGTEREAQPDDYPFAPGKWEFVTWQTTETPCEDKNGWMENDLFAEAYGMRPSGPRIGDAQGHGVYAKDLNGDALDRLTDELAASLEIKLEGEEW